MTFPRCSDDYTHTIVNMYPTDLKLNSDRDIQLNDANDLATVSGERNMEQSVAISAGDAVDDFVGDRLTGVNISLLEERIKRNLKDNPMVSHVENVTVDEYDRRDDTVTLTVEVANDDNFQIEV